MHKRRDMEEICFVFFFEMDSFMVDTTPESVVSSGAAGTGLRPDADIFSLDFAVSRISFGACS